MEKIIVWDWDGTLVDSFETICQAHNTVRKQFGLPLWSLEDAKENVALSGRDMFPKMFGKNAQEAADIFYRAYEELAPKTVIAKQGREQLLKEMQAQGIKHLIVSNKRGDILRKECQALGWNDFFTVVVGAGDAQTDKPSAAPVELAYQTSNCLKDKKHLMIGDAPIDAHTAQASGISSLLLSGETHNVETLEKDADYVIEYVELSEFLNSYWGL